MQVVQPIRAAVGSAPAGRRHQADDQQQQQRRGVVHTQHAGPLSPVQKEVPFRPAVLLSPAATTHSSRDKSVHYVGNNYDVHPCAADKARWGARERLGLRRRRSHAVAAGACCCDHDSA